MSLISLANYKLMIGNCLIFAFIVACTGTQENSVSLQTELEESISALNALGYAFSASILQDHLNAITTRYDTRANKIGAHTQSATLSALDDNGRRLAGAEVIPRTMLGSVSGWATSYGWQLLDNAGECSSYRYDDPGTGEYLIARQANCLGYPVTCAFQKDSCAVHSSTPSVGTPHYVSYELSSPRELIGYSLSMRAINSHDSPCAPSTWEMQGSNDATTWTTLDIQDGYVFSVLEHYFELQAQSSAYHFYRFYVTANAGNGHRGESVGNGCWRSVRGKERR